MSVVIGVLVTVILILTAVIIFILYNNNKSSLQHHATTSSSTTSVPIKYDYTNYHSLPASDYVSHYSNDSYTEYSRPLLGPGLPPSGSGGKKLVWDLTFPPPPPLSPQSSLKFHQQSQHYH